MDLRKTVFRNLHSVFETDPQAQAAFHLTHPTAILTWTLRGTTLTISQNRDVPTLTYDLESGTIGNLLDRLVLDGFGISFVNTALLARPAWCLLDTSGEHGNEVISAYASPLWALMAAPSRESGAASQALGDMLAQLDFTQAKESWLDLWGYWLDVPRRPWMVDDDTAYAAFIADEVTRGRANNHAIERAIKAWTGKDVVIREPWKELMIWDKSHWGSGDTYWQDGNFYTFGTLQPRGNITPDEWALIEYIVDRNRALGCYRLPSAFDPGVIGVLLGEIEVAVALIAILAYHIDLDEIVVSTFGWGDIFHAEFIELSAPGWTGTWDDRTWADSSATITFGYSIHVEDTETCLCP